jgi:hypothetical protein
MVRRITLMLVCALLVIGCRPASPTPAATAVTEATSLPESASITPGIPTQAAPLSGISADQVKNAEYQLGAADVPRMVQMVNGSYQEGAAGGADFVEVRVTDFIALGDIDGDGVNEAAALVSENYGGSGVFVFLALYTVQNDAAAFQSSVFVDDRPQINAIAIEDNAVKLDIVVHGKDDPMCCPSLQTQRQYRLINDQLDLTNYATFTPDGKPRTIKIEAPLNGTEVSSSVQVKGSVAIAPFENNLTYSIKDGAGVELSRGAVPVNASAPGGPGTFQAVIPLGNILSSTLVIIEIQDVSAADGSLLAMDSVELVVK